MVLNLHLISMATSQQGQLHQLVDIQTLFHVNVKAALDESSNLLVNGFPFRLAEIENRRLLLGHLQRQSANDQNVQDDASAPHVSLARYYL